MQRFFPVFLAAIVCVLTSCAPRTPSSDFEIKIENDAVVIVKFLDQTATFAVVPKKIDGRPVKKIGPNAFWSCRALQTVAIPSSVETIDGGAFSGCDALKSFSVARPTRFQAVDGVLFSADGKTLVAFPPGKEATEYAVPDGVERIGDEAFFGCNALESVEIPSSVKIIGRNAFQCCYSLRPIEIPATVEAIAVGSTSDFALGFLPIPPSAIPPSVLFAQIEDDGVVIARFRDQTATVAVIPATIDGRPVKKIGPNAFWCCAALQTVDLPASVEEIGKGAFFLCRSLRSLEIPTSVETIDGRAFCGCDSLTSFSVAADNPRFKAVDGVLFSVDGKTLIKFPPGVKGLKGALPWTLTRRSDVKSSKYAIPDGVETIGADAFAHCVALQSIAIPTSVETIDSGAFFNCQALETVAIPASVKTVGPGAFSGCDALKSFSVDPANARFKTVDGVLFSVDGKTLVAFPPGKEATEYAVPDGVETIAEQAFAHCDALQSVAFPTSVKRIGANAFKGCDVLLSIALPSSVESLGESAFADCDALRSVEIADGVESLGESAFWGCDALRSVKIPSSVKKIGGNAFESYLVTLYGEVGSVAQKYADENHLRFEKISAQTDDAASPSLANPASDFETQVEGDGVVIVAFRNIGANVAVVPEKIDGRPVVKIGQGAFANWGFLKLVALPSSVKEIGDNAFTACNALRSVEIPASVREIGDEAFADCASDLTLYGAAGSVAEKYVAENGLSFKPLEAR